MTAKREARERALELLYESEAKGVHPVEVVASLPVDPLPYAVELATGVGDHRELLDHVVGGRARGWTVKRMPAVDRALLRLATYELAFAPDLPTGVAIDEAVDLARAFSTDASPSFVNGVLAAVVKDVRGDGPWAAAHRPAALALGCEGVVCQDDTGAPVTAEGVDLDVVTLVRDVQAAGVATVCVSDAADRLQDDLAAAGVAGAFGTIVDSSRAGQAMPDADVYAAVCEAAGVQPGEVLFVADGDENVHGALLGGLNGVRFQGVERLRAVLRRTKLLPG